MSLFLYNLRKSCLICEIFPLLKPPRYLKRLKEIRGVQAPFFSFRRVSEAQCHTATHLCLNAANHYEFSRLLIHISNQHKIK